ncbi:hypothetical protein [Kitasatospora kifunensis]|uniref:Bulb-type lectin domain-containing protein n=1 Tax=Kitasatospora kifunensis TaxID=58351 RepID=A0A7W7RBD4_KITKI|nr:hypothetical protein [Kitasatospora kifunensis]MBB4928834.1 hypothetical protein [Kitasatospora kifunensis]
MGITAIVAAATLLPATDASAASFPWPCSYDAGGFFFMNGTGVIHSGEAACTDRYELAAQNDGNLVLYNSSGSAIWSSGTWGHPGGTTAFDQSDGNFVLYDSNHNALWATGTWGHPGAWFFFQPDGNLVVYTGGNQFAPTGPIWSTGTYGR